MSNTALKEETMTGFREIYLSDLRESKANPRKHFDQEKLDELTASIKAHGVITPILVRPSNGHFEIAAGHRRFWAARAAALETIPAVVRPMSDVELLEVLTVENLQRRESRPVPEDVHPLEEGQGYQTLIKAGYAVERIAERVGRSEKYVYDRIKLLQLGKKAQDLFFAGTITAGHAILLSRISVADQDRAIEDDGGLLRPDNGLFDPLAPDKGEAEDPVKPVSVRELDAWIARHVRFDPKKADPVLFTGAAAAQGEEPDKLLAITREAQLSDDTRDPKSRVLGPRSWRAATGELDDTSNYGAVKKSKTCDLSVRGVFVTGPGQGTTLTICVAKEKCLVHYGAEIRARKKAKTGAKGGAAAGKVDRYELEEKKRNERYAKEEAGRKVWRATAPAIAEALVAKIGTAKLADLAAVVEGHCRPRGVVPPAAKLALPAGKSAEDVLRRAAFHVLADSIFDDWSGSRDAPKALKPFGVDVAKILKGAAPAKERACRKCGCTEAAACPGGCSWVSKDLCSSCKVQPSAKEKK